jgi:anti-sigma factor RsiW
MSDKWTEKLDRYLDGELASDEMRELDTHVRGCTSCAADVLSRVQLKRAVQSAGKRYQPSTEFRQRIRKSISRRSGRSLVRIWFAATAAVAVLLVIAFFTVSVRQRQLAELRTSSEIADLHVATLASANPVDVISTDRHTVKPWFQGKIPFTFNLPELQNSEFALLGGRVTYLDQAPGAELIYQVRKHRISVFIFNARQVNEALGSDSQRPLPFNLESWDQEGLRYFVIGDASRDDIHNLVDLFKRAARG